MKAPIAAWGCCFVAWAVVGAIACHWAFPCVVGKANVASWATQTSSVVVALAFAVVAWASVVVALAFVVVASTSVVVA